MKRLLPHLAFGLILTILLASTPPAARAATRTVSSTADAGPNTLRQALFDAINDSMITLITFDTSVFPPSSPATIFVHTVLPSISRATPPLTIDASNAGVILDGWELTRPSSIGGLIVQSNGNTIRGLTIQNFTANGIFIGSGTSGNSIGGDRKVGAGPNGQGNQIVSNGGSGIEIQGANSNVIRGNYIGVDRTGLFSQANAYNGVAIWKGASQNTIGGTTEGTRNVISGNAQNGVWIGNGSTAANSNSVIGNYIGTTADGLGPVNNRFSGISIQDGAHDNFISDNLISGNLHNGIYMSGTSTSGNEVLGNIIGPKHHGMDFIGQGQHGIAIVLGASNNFIGDGTPAGRNLISRNAQDGVLIDGANTSGNQVQGNYISTNINGTSALPNLQHGVELTKGAHHNTIGGRRSLGEGNLLSGDGNHGVVIHYGAHHNTVAGNLIGPDATGTFSLGNHPNGGVDIAEGAYDNLIGGPTEDEGNVISGNQTDGIALFDSRNIGTERNIVQHNRIGLTLNGDRPLPNLGPGVANIKGAAHTLIYSNSIAYNTEYGVWVGPCTEVSIGNMITQNSIYSNTLGGILTSCPIAPPTVTVASVGATETVVTGTTFPNAIVEIFSDDDGQGRVYEGTRQADSSGRFTLSKASFAGPNITATSRDANGDTSAFSLEPAHLDWTLLLYLNGDNDLSRIIFNLADTISAAGASPRANVLALVDGRSGIRAATKLYDLTRGQKTEIGGTYVTADGERNMGDGQTLEDFLTWARSRYHTRYIMLSVVDHGGGWAPGSEDYIPGTTPHRSHWLAGGSGLSWDFNPGSGFSSDYDYLDSDEIRAALDQITTNGTNKLDVVFYDVCLMGMLEVVYQIRSNAAYFVSSQNIGWAPEGSQNRYVRAIQGIGRNTTPRDMAGLLVDSYANAVPSIQHPYTISAVDTALLPGLTTAVNGLSTAISTTLKATPAKIRFLTQAYTETQKIDYDGDFQIEPETDGFVDLYDLAWHIERLFPDQLVKTAAGSVMTSLKAAVIAERHQSGYPWRFPLRFWDLNRINGLSIFMPLGEDLEFAIPDAVTLANAPAATRLVRLRDTYSSTQLQFVRDTQWKGLIDRYYQIIASPIPTSTPDGPVAPFLPTDVAPPTSTLTVSPNGFGAGNSITVTWTITDTQLDIEGKRIPGSGVVSATLSYSTNGSTWVPIPASTQGGLGGKYRFILPASSRIELSLRAIDKVGNLEAPKHGTNSLAITRVYLLTIRR
jgi:parallel beta-helix repeat protein